MRRMIPYNEWVKMKSDIADIEQKIDGAVSSVVYQKRISSGSWIHPEGTAQWYCTIQLKGDSIGLNDAIIVSISETATLEQYNAIVKANLSFTYTGNNYIRIDVNAIPPGTYNGENVGSGKYPPEVTIPLNFTVLTPSKIGL